MATIVHTREKFTFEITPPNGEEFFPEGWAWEYIKWARENLSEEYNKELDDDLISQLLDRWNLKLGLWTSNYTNEADAIAVKMRWG